MSRHAGDGSVDPRLRASSGRRPTRRRSTASVLLVAVVAATLSVLPGRSAGALNRTFTVPGDYATIQEAIAAATSGDRVVVGPGTYTGTVDFGGKSVIVESSDGPDTTVLDAQWSTGVKIGPGGTWRGFTVTHGAASFGAGMAVSGSGSIIEGNVFLDNAQGGGGFGAAIGGNGASPRIQGNRFVGNTCDGQWLSGVVSFVNGSSPSIVNNVFHDNPCRAVNFTLPTGSRPSVINNTFVRNQVAVRVDRRGESENQVFRNNLIYDNGIGLESDFGTDAENPTWEHNLVSRNDVDYDLVANQTGQAGNLDDDPLLADPASDLRLRPGSPAIDRGTSAGAPATDFDGASRPQDGDGDGDPVPDIGAFEAPTLPVASVAVDLAAEQASVIAGTVIDYRATVTNTGQRRLTGVEIAFTRTPACTRTLADLEVDESATVTCAYTAAFGDIGTFENLAVVRTNETPETSSSPTTVEVTGHPWLSVDLQAASTTVTAGAPIAYRAEVVNTGDVTLTGVALASDVVADCNRPIGTLMPDERAVVDCNHPSTIEDGDRFRHQVRAGANEREPVDSAEVAVAVVAPASGASDVRPGAATRPAIDWTVAAGLLRTGSDARFRPGRPISRAEAVTMLWRLAGRPDAPGPSPFTDVPEGAWYEDAATWAADRRLVAVFSGGRFAPRAAVTRARFTVMAWTLVGRPHGFARYRYKDVPRNAGYGTAVDWAHARDLLPTKRPRWFRPNAPMTRARAADLVHRLAGDPESWERWDGPTLPLWRWR